MQVYSILAIIVYGLALYGIGEDCWVSLPHLMINFPPESGLDELETFSMVTLASVLSSVMVGSIEELSPSITFKTSTIKVKAV